MSDERIDQTLEEPSQPMLQAAPAQVAKEASGVRPNSTKAVHKHQALTR